MCRVKVNGGANIVTIEYSRINKVIAQRRNLPYRKDSPEGEIVGVQLSWSLTI